MSDHTWLLDTRFLFFHGAADSMAMELIHQQLNSWPPADVRRMERRVQFLARAPQR